MQDEFERCPSCQAQHEFWEQIAVRDNENNSLEVRQGAQRQIEHLLYVLDVIGYTCTQRQEM